MKVRRRLPRDLRRYEQLRVIVTTTTGAGFDGFLDGVYRDHVALIDAAGLQAGTNGQTIREPATPGPHVILKDQIVRMQVVHS